MLSVKNYSFDFSLKNNIKLPEKRKNISFLSNDNYPKDSVEIRHTPTLTRDVFFIRMNYYEKNYDWVDNMLLLTRDISRRVKKKENFDLILNVAETEVQYINAPQTDYGSKRKIRGRFMLSKTGRGEEYLDRYLKKIGENKTDYSPRSNKEYKNANICKINKSKTEEDVYIEYGWSKDNEHSNLEFAKEEYNKLINTKNPSLKQINTSCATIQWLIAQECPYTRGNDSIANVLTKAIYHAYNVKLTPLKKDVSLDFEAFYRNLDDYIKNYPYFFEKLPEKI